MAYSTTPLRLEVHRDAVARLWAEEMSDARIGGALPGRMRWLYEDDPGGGATTVLCRDDGSGEVIGCGSYFRRAAWVGGRSVRAGVLCDFAVDPAHRVGGAAIQIQRSLLERARAGGLELLVGHPNPKALPVFKRVGYRVVGETTSWLKPLRGARALHKVLRWKDVASVAAVPLDAALRVLDRARAAGRPQLHGERLPPLDARVDALWIRARAQYEVVGEQSSGYLAWRYGGFPTGEHGVFGVFPPHEERLVGFAAYGLDGPKAIVCDLFADHLESSAAPLLLRLAAHLRSHGAEWLSLSYVGPPSFGAQLRSAGFVPRSGRRPVIVYPLGMDERQRARLLDPASWFMLEGELDL